MKTEHFQEFAKARDSLIAAEVNPTPERLKLLHDRLARLLTLFSHLFTDEQMQTLSGGTKE